MKKILKTVYRLFINSKEALLNIWHVTRVRCSSRFYQSRIRTEVQRTVHQIEKGLSINNPRVGFGYTKIDMLIKYLSQMSFDNQEAGEIMTRAACCIKSYFDYFDKRGWESEQLIELKNKFDKLNLQYNYDNTAGGLLEINRVNYEDRVFVDLYNLAQNRHSIRDFDDGEVELEDLYKAISFAQTAPSACNRQSYRVYVIYKKMYPKLKEWLGDIGYFGDYGFDKILLVTAKITGYNESENMQHLVSPGIFVGYLTLGLEALNIGSCIIQRGLYENKKWKSARRLMHIPDDEQSFCLIGCGKKKNRYKVPSSKRLTTSSITQVIK